MGARILLFIPSISKEEVKLKIINRL